MGIQYLPPKKEWYSDEDYENYEEDDSDNIDEGKELLNELLCQRQGAFIFYVCRLLIRNFYPWLQKIAINEFDPISLSFIAIKPSDIHSFSLLRCNCHQFCNSLTSPLLLVFSLL